ncbi:hypothetical protein R1flu_018148 [Riccia fluitans]|uniref:Uncharacterized protein n=1 Tax=Riccia fluitans TaxID=41844 RepID=A0ABD1ZFA8_9MARC
MRRQYWMPGTDKGRKRFENKLVELETIAFAKAFVAPEGREFEHYTFQVEMRLRKSVTQAFGQGSKEFETWIKSDQFQEWTSERPVHFFPSTLWIEGYLDPYRARAEAWQEWFKIPRHELRNSNSLSFKYKECELISDNKICWINFMSWVTPMLQRCCLDVGLYGTVFKVGVLEPTLASDLGVHVMVFYVAKKLHNIEWSSSKEEMHKELFAFTISYPTMICGDFFTDMSHDEMVRFVSTRQISPALAKDRQQWPRFATTSQDSPPLAKLRQHWPSFASNGEALLALAKVRHHWQSFANIGEAWPAVAKVHHHWPRFATTGEASPPLAKVRHHR